MNNNAKKPLFQIKGSYLYREKNLIIAQVSVLFVCKDESGSRYLVLFADFDEDVYIICPITNACLRDFLTGQISFRKLYENADVIYKVQAGEDINTDEVQSVSCEEISDFLPERGVCFEIGQNKELEQYCSYITTGKG